MKVYITARGRSQRRYGRGAEGELRCAFDGPRSQTQDCEGTPAAALGHSRARQGQLADYSRLRKSWHWVLDSVPASQLRESGSAAVMRPDQDFKGRRQ